MSGPRLPESVIKTLANGLEILVVPEYASPVVSVQAWVKVGSVHEGKHLGAGISHLLEHLVFKGTRTFGASEAARVVQDVGGYLNAYTGFERTVYWIDAPAEGLATALDVTTELVFHPRFPEEEFEREKEVIRREIAMGKDDPGRVFGEELFATAFRVHPCRSPVIGHLGAFNKLTLEDVRAFHSTHYVPNNVFFVVSGAVEPAEVVALLGQRVGTLDPVGRAADVLPVEPALTGPRRREFTFATDVGRLQMAWHIPAQTHPDIPALDVLGRILGSGESARLYRRLREEAGLAHEIGAGIFSPGFAGVFHVGGEADAVNLGAMEAGIRSELDTLIRDGVSEAELEKARCGALVDFLRGLESTNGLARQTGTSWLLAHSTDYPTRYLDGLREVAAEKVRAIAENYLAADKAIVVSMLPESTGAKTSGSTAGTIRHAGGVAAITSVVLPNGATILLGRDPRLPLVSVQAYFNGGASADPPDKAGQSAWLAEGLWKGTTRSSAADLAERIESRGGGFSAASGNNSLALSVETLAADLDLAIDTLAEVLFEPEFPAAAMERERAAMLAAARERELQSLPSAGIEARRLLFAGTGFQNPAGGTAASLAGLDAADLPRQWRDMRFGANMVAGVFGDFDPDVVRTRLEQGFGRLETRAVVPARGQDRWERLPAGQRSDIRRPKEQAVLVVLYPTDGLHDPDATALDLIDEACDDMGSRIFQRIREEQGLAYFVSAFQVKGRHIGGVGFYLGTSAEKLDHAEAELLDEIGKLATGGLDAAELHRARQTWRGKFLLQNQSVDARGRLAVVNTLLGLGTDYAREQLELARLMSADSVNAAAAKVFSRQPVIVRVLPEG